MPGDTYLWVWDYFPGPSDNITSLVTVAALRLSADHCSLATACIPASPKAACFHHRHHRCTAALPYRLHLRVALFALHRRLSSPSSALLLRLAFQYQLRGEKDVEYQPCAVVCCIAQVQLFFIKEVFAWVSVFTCLCHAQLISRSLGASQTSPLLRLASAPALSLLPVIYLTGCYNLLILNS